MGAASRVSPGRFLSYVKCSGCNPVLSIKQKGCAISHKYPAKTKRTLYAPGHTRAGVAKYCHRICHRIGKLLIMVGQQDCPDSVLPLCLSPLLTKLKTAENRMRIHAGMPEDTIVSAVPRPLRSGRCPSCSFSAKADAASTRVSTPMMIVKAARFLWCAVIEYFLFTGVNTYFSSPVYFKPAIPTIFASFHQKRTICGIFPLQIILKKIMSD